LGWVAAAWLDNCLCALTFGHRDPQKAMAALRPSTVIEEVRVQDMRMVDEFAGRVQAYAKGNPDDFTDVPILLTGPTDFQRRVIRECRRIPYGHTLAYGDLADRAGSPNAARAVGSVMARNRIALVIPCHRVVGSAGKMGGYSAPDGILMKTRLLELEGAI
jgi:methylated-DNA-[protein]-cysteine S-methyltransferase